MRAAANRCAWLHRWGLSVMTSVALAMATSAHAETRQSRTVATGAAPSEIHSSVATASDTQRAREWGLHDEEWSRYRQLMQGPLGLLSPGLDPLTALGIEARSDAERRHYAELQVRFEAQRVQRELAYQQAYDEAWRQLYPGLQRVNITGAGAVSSASAAGNAQARLAVFVKANCPACDARVQQLQAAGTAFDVYVVGTQGDDTLVRAWATHAGVDAAKVRTHTITLNHDGGRWLSIGGQGGLPAVMQEVGGQWQRR